jgi:adenosylmethionine-8-amino-7-oxononanoate aminotransferase
MTIAKGLGGGYQPIGATLLSQKIFDAFKNGSGFFQHGHTYLGHPMACAAAMAVQQVIKRDRLLENVQKMGVHLMDRLQDRFGNHRHVGDIRGRGLFQAIELVQDRATKATFDPAKKLNARIKQEAMTLGLMCYPMGGTIDGRQGDHVLLAPPFICTKDDIDLIVEKLGDAVDTALKGIA